MAHNGGRGLGLTCVAALCAFPATWWMIGDLSEPDVYGGLDYSFGRLRIDEDLEAALGATSLLLGLIAVTLLIVRHRRQDVSTRWLGGSLMLVAVSAAAALCGRVLTAGTVGANIGGGMVLLFGAPVLALLSAFAIAISVARSSATVASVEPSR